MISLSRKNLRNKRIEAGIYSLVSVFSSVWMTLVSPILIGAFISYIFSSTSPPLKPTDYIIILALSVIHLFLSFLTYKSSTKKSISLEVDALISKVKNYNENIIPDLSNLFKTASIQRLVNYLMLVAIDECINELEKDSKEGKKIDHDALKKCFDKLFTPLVRHRNELFGYESDAFYNFALYLINEDEKELFIAWRSHDNRLQVSNRKWRPGFGHVGLTYIHDEIKICHDISKSTELSSNAQVSSDQSKYNSFLSVPIRDNSFDEGKTKGTHRPIGVLVLTSNKESQFDFERDKIFILTVAKLVAMFFGKITTKIIEQQSTKSNAATNTQNQEPA